MELSSNGLRVNVGAVSKPGGGMWASSTSNLQDQADPKNLTGVLCLKIIDNLQGISWTPHSSTERQIGFCADSVEHAIQQSIDEIADVCSTDSNAALCNENSTAAIAAFRNWVKTDRSKSKTLDMRGFEAVIVESIKELDNKIEYLMDLARS